MLCVVRQDLDSVINAELVPSKKFVSSNHGRRSGWYSATILQKCGGAVGVQILDFLGLGSLRIGLVTIDYLPTTLAPRVPSQRGCN